MCELIVVAGSSALEVLERLRGCAPAARGFSDPHRTRRALALVGLADKATADETSLTAAERWRLAIARALAADLPLVLVDATGRRGCASRDAALLLGIRDAGYTVWVATSDIELAGYADRVLLAEHGRVAALTGPFAGSTLDRTRAVHQLLRGAT